MDSDSGNPVEAAQKQVLVSRLTPLTTVHPPALTGVLAALTIALGLGGFSTIRRATI